jgi:hypothetical protein
MAHTRVAAPSSCLPRTLITAGGKHCPHSIHTHNTRKSANQNCAHATPNSQIRREQTRIVYTQQQIQKSQITQTHTQEHTRGGGSKWRFKRGWESGYYQGIVDANGAQDRSQPYQTQAQGMLFVSRKYKSTTLLISLSLSLSVVV